MRKEEKLFGNSHRKPKEDLREKLPRYFLLYFLVFISGIFGFANQNIFSPTGITTILTTASIQGILSLGLMLELTTGNFDLSIGANAGLAAAVVGFIMSTADPSFYPIAFLIGVLCSACVGGVNAFFTVRIGVPAFISTLAMRSILGAFTALLTNNTIYYSNNWGNTFRLLGQGKLYGIVPFSVIIFVIIVILVYFFTEKTRTGRYIYATGANRTAALNVGIPVIKMQVLSFVLGGGLAAIGGILHSSRNYSTSVQMGLDLQLPAQICCLLGATFLTPGKYNVPGCVVGILLTTIITNGVYSTIGSAVYAKNILEGLTFMVAIGIIATIRKEGLPKVRFDI